MDDTIEGVSVIIRREECFLLVRRAHPPFQYMLAFPGGRVRKGESLHDAARREVEEETGLSTNALEAADTFDIETEKGRYRLHVFSATAEGDAVAGDDAASLYWLDLEAMQRQRKEITEDTLRLAQSFATEKAHRVERPS
ncbi:NUDIX hydrolase [Notoacmeibacter ruber]|nr:NUDIX domain-containing protein [Notoacmeibacter ruber]